MSTQHDVRKRPKRAVVLKRFSLEDIQRCAGEAVVRQRVDQGTFLYDGASGDINQIRIRLNPRQRVRVDQMGRLWSQRAGENDESTCTQKCFEVN